MSNDRFVISKVETAAYNLVLAIVVASAVAYPYMEVELFGAKPTLFDAILFYGGLLWIGWSLRFAWITYKHGEVEYRGLGSRIIHQLPELQYDEFKERSGGNNDE